MNKASDSIHRLIIGMNKKERDYFSRFVFNDKRKGENKLLLQLFNAIAKMKVYDEAKLLKTFSSKLKANSFKTLKSELKKIIQNSIEAQDSRATPTMQWRKKMNRIELLKGSGLYKEALLLVQELKKSEPFFDDDYNTLHYIEAVKNEKEVLQLSGQLNLMQLETLEKSVKTSVDVFWLDRNAETLTLVLTNISSHNLLMNGVQDEQNFKKAHEKFTTFVSNHKGILYYYKNRGHIAASLISADYKSYLQQALTVWKNLNHPLHIYDCYIQRYPHWYADMFSTAVHACILTKNTQALETILPEAETGIDKYFPDNEYVRSYLYHAQLMLGYLQNNTIHMQQYAAVVEKHLIPENDLARYRYFSTSLAITQYHLGNYKSALRHTNNVMATDPRNLDEIHYREFCNIFRLVIEFDLLKETKAKDYRSFNTTLDACFHSLKRDNSKEHPKQNSYELELVTYLTKIAAFTTIDDFSEAHQVFHTQIAFLQSSPTFLHFNSLFDFTAWIEKQKPVSLKKIG